MRECMERTKIIKEIFSINIKLVELDSQLAQVNTPFGPPIDFTFYRTESEKLYERLESLALDKGETDSNIKDYIDKLLVSISIFSEISLRMEETAKGSLYAKSNNTELITFKDFKKLRAQYEDSKTKLMKMPLFEEIFGDYLKDDMDEKLRKSTKFRDDMEFRRDSEFSNNGKIAKNISIIVFLLGLIFSKPFLWIPFTVFLASLVQIYTVDWVADERSVGKYRGLSEFLKFICGIVGMYALMGAIVCIGLVIYWFIF